ALPLASGPLLGWQLARVVVAEEHSGVGNEALLTAGDVEDPKAVGRVVPVVGAQEDDPRSVGGDGDGPRLPEGQAAGSHVLPGEGVVGGGRGRVGVHQEPGSTRILACASGWASASNAPGTPSTGTDPVSMGVRSRLPAAMTSRQAANSSGS